MLLMCRQAPDRAPPPAAPDPAQEMARVCRPGGRILLLQHGQGSWGFVNSILDSGAGAWVCPCSG